MEELAFRPASKSLKLIRGFSPGLANAGLIRPSLSFGGDLKDKRVIVVDLDKKLGQDLKKRFDFVYDNSAVMFSYEAREIKIDKLEGSNSLAASRHEL